MPITHIGNAIQVLLKSNPSLKKAFDTYQVKKIVEHKLGDFFINKGVSVKSIQHKTLFLICENASLKSEILLRKGLIIKEVNTETNEELINEVVILNQ